MSILAKHIELVNGQKVFHEKQAEKLAGSWRARMHLNTSEKFAALAADLEATDKLLDGPAAQAPRPPKTAHSPIQLSLNIEEIADLPPELLQELSISEADKTEFAILNAVEEAGGVITLDRLLIALYKNTGEIHKRQNMTSKIYRMTSKGQLYNVPGKKGVYSNEQLTSEDVAKLFPTVKGDTRLLLDNA